MMEEHRRFVRLDTRLDISYTVLPDAESARAVTTNIGGGGICLFAHSTLKPGERLKVSMKLPGCEKPVNFIGEVVWCEEYEVIGKDERKRSVEIGVKFIEIAPQDQDAVMQYVILSVQPRAPRPPLPQLPPTE